MTRAHDNYRLSEPKLIAAAAALLVTAGVIHVLSAPAHWGHAPTHTVFLLLTGLGEIAWGFVSWRRPSAALYRIGVALAGGLLTLWLLSGLLPVPLGHERETPDLLGNVSTLAEGLGLVILVGSSVLGAAGRTAMPLGWRTAVGFTAVGVTVGGLTYGIAAAAEPLTPWLGTPARHADDARQSATLREAQPDTLELVNGGIASPFANGGEIPVVGDVVVQVTVESGDARASRRVHVYLHHDTATRAPIADAGVQATVHMRFMDHGTLQRAAVPTGDGHYLLPLQFAMPGEWQIDLTITTPDSQGTIHLNLDLGE
ncbi:MAG: FixH family protein [Chloroflexi bacterium]|nr:FixH family protein [Chloroflexota bacterium]